MKTKDSKWSLDNDNCISCKTTLKPHKAKGLCTKCYSVNKELDKINDASPENLDFYKLNYLSIEERNKLKKIDIEKQKSFIKEKVIEKKLRYIKQYGLIETKEVKTDVLKLENIFNVISNKVCKEKDIYSNHLSVLNTSFNEEQRKIIALLLLKMLV